MHNDSPTIGHRCANDICMTFAWHWHFTPAGHVGTCGQFGHPQKLVCHHHLITIVAYVRPESTFSGQPHLYDPISHVWISCLNPVWTPKMARFNMKPYETRIRLGVWTQKSPTGLPRLMARPCGEFSATIGQHVRSAANGTKTPLSAEQAAQMGCPLWWCCCKNWWLDVNWRFCGNIMKMENVRFL